MECGLLINMDFFGNIIYFDVIYLGVCDYVWGKVKCNYYDKGVKLFWLDEVEFEFSVYDYDNYCYYVGLVLEVGNIYLCMYVKIFFDGMKVDGEDKVINLLCCVWVGSQKYGVLVWLGDIYFLFRLLCNQFVVGFNMGIVGILWWMMDIGGFYGGNIYDLKFYELLICWFQWGVFSLVMCLYGNCDLQILFV